MSACVVDASAALAWCFREEASEAADELLDGMREEGAVVPGLWHLEIANVLTTAERKGRITAAQASEKIDLLGRLPIVVDERTHERAFGQAFALARQYELSVYDAAYLELAMRRGLPLATKDRALIRAAVSAGVPVIPV